MSKWKKLLILMLIMIVAMLPVQTMAIDPIDLTQPVSLAINYKWEGTQFDIYRVADSDRFAVFTLSGDFTDFKRDINSCKNSDDWDFMTKNVVAYATANQLRPMHTAYVHDKICQFSDLKAGLYLVIGHNIDEGDMTYSVDPFLICLPDRDMNDVWMYDTMALPKFTATKHNPPHHNDPPPDLPQTGQLWWPVPVLLGCGVVSLLIGATRRKGDRDE